MAVYWSLSGGGIKGAFQLGAAMGIHRVAPEYAPVAIAGTSVGAINALSLAAFDLPRAIGVLTDEYLRLSERSDMYTVSADFQNLLNADLLEDFDPKLSDTLALADGLASSDPVPAITFLLDPIIDEAVEFGLRAGGVTGAGLLLGPPGLLVTGGVAGFFALTAKRLIDDFKQAFKRLGSMQSFYTLTPIGQRIIRNVSTFDFDAIKPMRLEVVDYETGRTHAIDHQRRFRKDLDDMSFPTAAVELIGPPEQVLTRGALASAAIPMAFNPIVLTELATQQQHTMVDGGVRSTYPILSTLDLVAEDPSPTLISIGNSRIFGSMHHETRNWPIFSERSFPAYDYRSDVGADKSDKFLSYISRAIGIRNRDAPVMGRALLNERTETITVIEPSISIIGTAQVDPGLIRIWIAYGYNRAADVLADDRLQTGFHYVSDWLCASRKTIWEVEAAGGPVSLSLNRRLYLAGLALTAERERLQPNSVPPSPDTIRTDYLDPAERTLTNERLSLEFDGSAWMPREEALNKYEPLFAGRFPFDELQGRWPRTDTEAFRLYLTRVAEYVSGIDPPEPDTEEDFEDPVIDEAIDEIFVPFNVKAASQPTERFRLWRAGAQVFLAGNSTSRLAIVSGVNPFTNELVHTYLALPDADADLEAFYLSADGLESVGDHAVGVLNNISLALPLEGSGGTGVFVIRGASGDFYAGPAWQRLNAPARVDLRRADVPREGHTAILTAENHILLAAQSTNGNIIKVETDGDRLVDWKEYKINWKNSKWIPNVQRNSFGSQLPIIQTMESYGVFLHTEDGKLWFAEFPAYELEIHPVEVSEALYQFSMNGASLRNGAAVFSGIDGDIVRRIRVERTPTGDFSVHECPRVDVGALDIQHFGMSLPNAVSDDIVAIVPCVSGGQEAWLWIDGCGDEPPRVRVSEGPGTNLTPNRD